MTWWVNVRQEVVDGVASFGLSDGEADALLNFVEGYLRQNADGCMPNRWPLCPDDYFLYEHVTFAGGHWHLLRFIVRDSSKESGVIEVVWVEDEVGDEAG